MIMTPAKTRQDAIDRFWTDVEDLLKKKGHTARNAQKGIDDYRRKVATRNLGEVVYNQGEEQTANVIDSVINQKRPVPGRS